jgi:hypothetical protein
MMSAEVNGGGDVSTFTEVASLGTNGSWDEKGRNAIYTALKSLKDKNNAGSLRDRGHRSMNGALRWLRSGGIREFFLVRRPALDAVQVRTFAGVVTKSFE